MWRIIVLPLCLFAVNVYAQGQLELVSVETPVFKSQVTDSALATALKGIPNIVQRNRIHLGGGNLTKARLIQQWESKNKRPDPGGYYYKNATDVFNFMDRVFKNIYFNLLSSDEIRDELLRKGVRFNGNEKFFANNYIINEKPESKDGLLMLSIYNYCVVKGKRVEFVSVKSYGPLQSSGCSGGSIHHIVKIHRIQYEPLCDGRYCKLKDDLRNTFSAKQIYPAPKVRIEPKPMPHGSTAK